MTAFNSPCGEDHYEAKLTADDVREIRDRAARGESHRDLAAEFEVAQTTISQAIRRVTWAHVE